MAHAIDELASRPYLRGQGETGFESTSGGENVFPDELLRLPPYRDVDFTIELHPSTTPISMIPHRMFPIELQELKVQLQYLLDRGFIRPSTSP